MPHIRHDQRWPRYVPPAVEEGLLSPLAVRLFLDDDGTVGGLNLYSTVSYRVMVDATRPLADVASKILRLVWLSGADHRSAGMVRKEQTPTERSCRQQ